MFQTAFGYHQKFESLFLNNKLIFLPGQRSVHLPAYIDHSLSVKS